MIAHKRINLFILLVIFSFCFLSVGLANAGLGHPSLRVSAYVTPSEIERGSSGELIVTVSEVGGVDWAKDVTVTPSISPLDGCTISPSSKSTSGIGESSSTTFHFTIYVSKDATLGRRSVHISVKYYETGWLDIGTFGPDYSTGSTKFSVKKGHGFISISSIPSGAKVYIDGVYKGTTPLFLSVEEGKHTIKLTKEYYYDVEESVFVKIGETTYVSKTLKGYGFIRVDSNPSGAKVYLDGVYKGETPLFLSKVAEGTHTIKLTKQYYNDVTRTVSVSIGKTTHVYETLTGYGSISISSFPSGASVYLDGYYKGVTPLFLSKVIEGSHTIKLAKSGYAELTKTIYVYPGKTTYVSETLSFATWLLTSIFGMIALISVFIVIFVIRRKKREKLTATKAEEITEKGKTEEVKIPETEEVRERLRETYPEKDAVRLANAFRIIQDIKSLYCNTNTKAGEISKEFDLLKMYLTEKEFLNEVESIQRKINAELREEQRLSEKHVEEVKDFCEKFIEMWIARFLR